MSYGFSIDILKEFERISEKTNIYIFCNKNLLRTLFDFYKDKNVDLLIWKKTNPIPRCNNKYLSDLEYIFFARDENVKVNKEYSTLSKLFVTSVNKNDKNMFGHPTIKPISIIRTLIINSSNENDIILDPFMGSGTVAVASKELHRHFIGFEIDSEYYEKSLDRLKGITIDDKIAEKNGQIKLF